MPYSLRWDFCWVQDLSWRKPPGLDCARASVAHLFWTASSMPCCCCTCIVLKDARACINEVVMALHGIASMSLAEYSSGRSCVQCAWSGVSASFSFIQGVMYRAVAHGDVKAAVLATMSIKAAVDWTKEQAPRRQLENIRRKYQSHVTCTELRESLQSCRCRQTWPSQNKSRHTTKCSFWCNLPPLRRSAIGAGLTRCALTRWR